MKITLARTVTTAVQPSDRVMQSASMFGIGVDGEQTYTIISPTTFELPTPGPAVMYITGPSGSGKSTMLTLIGQQCAASNIAVIDLNQLPTLAEQPLVDLFDLPLPRTLALLSRAGLSDAFVLLRTPSQLSDGQRYRLKLAQAMHLAADTASVILADEFGAQLDRLTAAILARNVRAWTNRSKCTFIVATTHEDLLDALQPDVLAYKGLGSDVQIVTRALQQPQQAHHASNALVQSLRMEPATLHDYRTLAAFHYKAAHPAAITSGYRLVHDSPTIVGRYLQHPHERMTVGVLLRTLPHLSCSLRDHATSNRYRRLPARESAVILNREVRTIARVVIHPQWRGLGLAVKLVAHSLANPEPHTQYTEALAAMGHVHPFFEKAGMVRYERPPHAAHARLLDALAHLNIQPHLLASPRAVREACEVDAQHWSLLMRELGRWHRAAARPPKKPPKKTPAKPTTDELLHAARDQLMTLPVYYLAHHDTHTHLESRS